MGRPYKWVLTADLTYMSKYQLRKWRCLMFCPSHSHPYPFILGLGGQECKRTAVKWILTADWTCRHRKISSLASPNHTDLILKHLFPWNSLIPEISPGGPQRPGTGRDEKKNTSWKLILHVWAKISWKICDAPWCIFLEKFWGKLEIANSP